MSIVLDHTIVPTHDKEASAQWLAYLFGREPKESRGAYAQLPVSDALTLLFYDSKESFEPHHYAFLITEEEFEAILGRLKEKGIPYGDDAAVLDNFQIKPRGNPKGVGRGLYFRDPNGHSLEIITCR